MGVRTKNDSIRKTFVWNQDKGDDPFNYAKRLVKSITNTIKLKNDIKFGMHYRSKAVDRNNICFKKNCHIHPIYNLIRDFYSLSEKGSVVNS